MPETDTPAVAPPTAEVIAAIRARWLAPRPDTLVLDALGAVDDVYDLLAALDAVTAQRDLLRDDVAARVPALARERDAAVAALDELRCDIQARDRALAEAQCRVPTKDGRTLILTARELHEAHRQARALYESARRWAAAWKRAAIRNRERRRGLQADVAARADEQLTTTCLWAQAVEERDALRARLGAATRVVEAARALAVARRERRAAMDDAIDIRVFGEADTRYGAALDALDAAVAARDDAGEG